MAHDPTHTPHEFHVEEEKGLTWFERLYIPKPWVGPLAD